MKNFIIAAVAVTTVTFASTNMAEARSKVRFSIGGNGWNVSVGGRNYNNFRSRNVNFRRNYNYRNNYNYGNSRICPTLYRPAQTWHDTSHWDYRPAQLIRHGNHYDYIPARYDYHRTGHWDHNHR